MFLHRIRKEGCSLCPQNTAASPSVSSDRNGFYQDQRTWHSLCPRAVGYRQYRFSSTQEMKFSLFLCTPSDGSRFPFSSVFILRLDLCRLLHASQSLGVMSHWGFSSWFHHQRHFDPGSASTPFAETDCGAHQSPWRAHLSLLENSTTLTQALHKQSCKHLKHGLGPKKLLMEVIMSTECHCHALESGVFSDFNRHFFTGQNIW